jgi:hypothetical protein
MRVSDSPSLTGCQQARDFLHIKIEFGTQDFLVQELEPFNWVH